MKKKIIDALKNKFKNLGFGDKAFDGVATYLEPSIKEETEIETAISGVENLLKAFQGEADKIRTEKTAAEKRLAELEARVRELGGAPAKTEPEKEVEEDKDTPAWAKAIIEANKALTARLTAMEGEKISTNRKQQLDAIINKLPESLRKSYARTPVKDMSDEDFASLTAEISTEVEQLVKETNAKGAVFGRPANVNSNVDTSKECTDKEANDVVDRFNFV